MTKGVTIARDNTEPAFRLFDVAPHSALDLVGLTLTGGDAVGGAGGDGAAGGGGAAGMVLPAG